MSSYRDWRRAQVDEVDGADEHELGELEDPVRNLRVGVVAPLARSVGLAALALIGSVMGALALGSADWWLPLMALATALLWSLERRRGKERARERRASDRLLGIRRDEL